jgi:hypothetical protein
MGVRPGALVALIQVFAVAQDQDEMLRIAEKALEKAKTHYDRKEYFDCIAEAEKARNMFQALVELYDSQKRTSDRQKCSDLAKQCNQLIKLANDGRKQSTGRSDPPLNDKPQPPPKPVEPSRPDPPKPVEDKPKPPEPDPDLAPPCLAEFGRLVGGAIEPSDAPKMMALLRDLQSLARTAGPWQIYAAVALTVVHRLVEGVWTIAPEDRPAFKQYADKHLGSAKIDHRLAVLQLAAAAESVEGHVLRWRLFRLLAVAHAAQGLRSADSPLHLELLTKAKILELEQDDKERWVTREGASIAAIRAALEEKDARPAEISKSAPKVKEPTRDAFKAFALFESLSRCDVAGAKELLPECKSAMGASEPSAAKRLSALKAILDSKKICSSCQGTHKKKCPFKCDENGKKTAACNRCGGPGYAIIRGRRADCLAPPPPGKKWEEGHTYKETCPKCNGKAFEECRLCDAPWSGAALKEGIKTDACDSCGGSGWLIAEVKLPCYACFATGSRYGGLANK